MAERRAFVTKTKQALVKVYNNLESDYVKNKIANDERDVRITPLGHGGAREEAAQLTSFLSQFQRNRQYTGSVGLAAGTGGGGGTENGAFIDEQRSRQHVSWITSPQGVWGEEDSPIHFHCTLPTSS